MANMSEIEKLEGELEMILRPPVKAMRDRNAAHKKQAACRFRKMVDAACESGRWNPYSLARRLGISNQYFRDLYKGNRLIQAWIFEALPEESRKEQARTLIKELRAASNV